MSVEAYFWHSQKFLFPQIEIPNPIPSALPFSHSLLLVTLEKTGEIKINSEVRADLSDTERLLTELKNIFEKREKNGVFEPNSEKVLKAIAVKANIHQNYGDVLKVIETIEASGADPIVLELNELPR